MQIYVGRSNQRFGPFTLPELQAHIDAGTVLPTDLAWHKGLESWREVLQLEGLVFPAGRVPPVLPGSPGATAFGPPQTRKPIVSGELILLVLLSTFVPLIGVLIGLVRLLKPERRAEGLILFGISISLMALYTILLLLLVV